MTISGQTAVSRSYCQPLYNSASFMHKVKPCVIPKGTGDGGQTGMPTTISNKMGQESW